MIFLFLAVALAVVRYREEHEIQHPAGLSHVNRMNLLEGETLKLKRSTLYHTANKLIHQIPLNVVYLVLLVI